MLLFRLRHARPSSLMRIHLCWGWKAMLTSCCSVCLLMQGNAGASCWPVKIACWMSVDDRLITQGLQSRAGPAAMSHPAADSAPAAPCDHRAMLR